MTPSRAPRLTHSRSPRTRPSRRRSRRTRARSDCGRRGSPRRRFARAPRPSPSTPEAPGHLAVAVFAGASVDVEEPSPFARPAPRRHGVRSQIGVPFGEQISFTSAVRRREIALAALAEVSCIHCRNMARVEVEGHEIRGATQRVEEARIVHVVSVGHYQPIAWRAPARGLYR